MPISITRDDNNITVLAALARSDDSIVLLSVDPDNGVTGYINVVDSVPTYPSSYKTRDDNDVPVLFGDYNGTAMPLLIDSANGGVVAIIS